MSSQAPSNISALDSTGHHITRQSLQHDQDPDRGPQELEHQQQDPGNMKPKHQEQEKDEQEPRFIRFIPAVYASLTIVGAIPILQGALSLPGPSFVLFVLIFIMFYFVSPKKRENEEREHESRLKDDIIKSLKGHVQLLQQINHMLEPQRQENRELRREIMGLLRQENARLEELYARLVREVEGSPIWMGDDEADEL